MSENRIIDCITKIETEDGRKRMLMSSDFKSFGRNVQIFSQVKFVRSHVIDIGNYVKIDDFTFIYGGTGIKIGNYVHIASFVSIIGGGELELGDYSALAAGSRIITGSNLHQGGYHMTASAPEEQQNVKRGKIIIGKDAVIGTNAIVHPCLTIGDGAILGSNSLALTDLEPWTIYAGSPCKKIGIREQIRRFD